jgi:hypothetical protein
MHYLLMLIHSALENFGEGAQDVIFDAGFSVALH